MMVTVRIFGGLANQMFQYAFGRAFSLRKNTELCLDYYEQILRTDFDGENLIRITDIFDLPVKLYIGKARKDFISRYKLRYVDQFITALQHKTSCVITEHNYAHSQTKIEKNENFYLIGHWQSERYFVDIKDIIRNDFRFKIEEQISKLDLYQEMTQSNSVSLHIRGKDYVKNPYYSQCDVHYYLNAIDKISRDNSSLKFYIFTDDLDHVRENYKELLEFSKIVNVRTPFKSEIVDLLLMSRCQHNIICNSSFSWWGAWLNNNPNKIVISPQRWITSTWLNKSHYSEESITPVSWHKI